MAVIKCKMCGGTLNLTEGLTVAECEYCGSRQTIPTADNEKKMTLFTRAARLLRGCEFDKAAGVFEAIVADFPEEAEAYWGLVLCKYGIEYVDDPATGKKISTCHRSSFDSVLDDENFEQACENTDAIARRVYRDEARQIEELRKAIIEVSGKEEPYDIFISYKETDTDGQRTLDSVLAQDIYAELTEKGYRVFFSRISLEDKLGTEYEPYIFAALNSAKLMLVVGTDYEHFDAVWVKNEWSRFLKLMASGQKKVLIPVFKNMDAYDMPKEFAKLAAQDMGKIGAMQDLLRGVEKIVGKRGEAAAAKPAMEGKVTEQVIIRESGSGPNVTAMLDRGNMALEDRKWKEAEDFFNRALDMDAKCGAAYLGLSLVEQQASSLNDLVKRQKDALKNFDFQRETLAACEEDSNRIQAATEKYAIKGYLSEEEIRTLFSFDRSYKSTLSSCKAQKEQTLAPFKQNKNLQRAEQYGDETVKAQVQKLQNEITAVLDENIAKAKKADEANVEKIQRAYAQHLDKAEEQAKHLYEQALAKQEADYQAACVLEEKAKKEVEHKKAAAAFAALGEYKDSPQRRQQCQTRAEESFLQTRYEAACSLLAKPEKPWDRDLAHYEFLMLGDYQDSREMAEKCRQDKASSSKKSFLDSLFSSDPATPYERAKKTYHRSGNSSVLVKLTQDQISARTQKRLLWLWDYEKDPTLLTRVSDAYQQAEALRQKGDLPKAYSLLLRSYDYKYAAQLYLKMTRHQTITAGSNHTAGLRSDGTAVAVGDGYPDQYDVSDWQDISAVAVGEYHTVGLRSDGTVVAAGDNNYGQCNVSNWTDIVAIAARLCRTVGLRSDGAVVAVGNNDYGQCNVSEWTDIVTIAEGGWHTVGLRSDGTMVAVGYNEDGRCNVGNWTDIMSIAVSDYHTVGLRSDGTVVAAGDNNYGQCEVRNWTDIVAIAAGIRHTVGLRSDGTVVAVGDNDDGRCNVNNWTNIVAIAARLCHTVGLRVDGTLVAVGYNNDGRCNVRNWTDIVAIAEGDWHTVGLRSDGTVVVAGDNDDGQCNVRNWTDIVAIAAGIRHTVGLRSDGTVVAVGNNNDSQCNVSNWTDIVAIAVGDSYTVGLRSDGTVVPTEDDEYKEGEWTDIVAIAASSYTFGLRADGTVVTTEYDESAINYQGQCEVSEWTDMVAIAAGDCHTVGLRSDGTVVSTKYKGFVLNNHGQCEVSDWTDMVAIAAGSRHTVGLRSDGTVVATRYTGDQEYYCGQCEVSGWIGIVAIAAGGGHTVGLRADGSVVATKYTGDQEEYSGQCEVSDWTNIVAIAAGGDHTVGLRRDGTIVATKYTGGQEDYFGQCNVSKWRDIRIPSL